MTIPRKGRRTFARSILQPFCRIEFNDSGLPMLAPRRSMEFSGRVQSGRDSATKDDGSQRTKRERARRAKEILGRDEARTVSLLSELITRRTANRAKWIFSRGYDALADISRQDIRAAGWTRGIIHALAGNASLVTRWGPTFLPMIEIKSVDTREIIRKIIIDKTFLRSSSWWI